MGSNFHAVEGGKESEWFRIRRELVDGVSRWRYIIRSRPSGGSRWSVELFGNLAAIEVASKRS
ncbi:MAG: hypothetical protein ABGZ17_12415, partial [Planctomycetaceae bacterium]